MRWFFDWHDLWSLDLDEKLRPVRAKWGLSDDVDEDDEGDDAEDVDEEEEDDDPWSSSVSGTVALRVPRAVGARSGVARAPEDGEGWTVSFELQAEPHEGVVMSVDPEALDNAVCAPLLQRLGDDIAAALGGQLDERAFQAKFRSDDDE